MRKLQAKSRKSFTGKGVESVTSMQIRMSPPEAIIENDDFVTIKKLYSYILIH